MKKPLIVIFATLCFGFALFFGAKTMFAGTGNNTIGYAWSSNIGWIKMNNCENPAVPATCTGGDYGVSILPVAPGTISGYAWSSNVGWITFNAAGCPTSGCTPGARVDWTTRAVKGWARACSVYVSGCSGTLNEQPMLGGWDGYIALDSVTAGGSGGSWGWKVGSDNKISGYAWGSQVLGWIKSVSMSINTSGLTVALVANPTMIEEGESSTLTLTATNIDGPNACSIAGLSAITMVKGSNDIWTATKSVSPTKKTEYTATCTKGTATAEAKATVDVHIFKNPPEGGSSSGGAGYCAVTNPQFTWSSTADSCTITRQGGGSQTVAGTSQAAGGTLGSDGLYYFTSNLAVQGTASTYTLKCVGVAKDLTLTVNRCIPDFAIAATPNLQTLVPAGEEGKMVATFVVSVTPVNGFTGPVNLSVASWPSNIPSSKVAAFSPVTLTGSGGVYGTSSFTVTIDAEDLNTTTTYTPVIIQGKSGSLTRQASVKVGAEAKTKPTYEEF